ncbi:ABC transporter permease [Leptothoe kymatousa TAU-MAC 1615]|uniref:ABC transporter permease n=2 Tax=Leptothoe TaxID=2651725 RepID=A0ABS5Y5U4_9CYAN|nr:ABC transporter permease [Leptothoe kymatousa TAU-MAC 1615]
MMVLLTGQIIIRLVRGRCNRRNMMEHLACAGPDAMMPVLLTNLFAGMIFATQSARELIRYGAIGQIGGAFAFGYIRELAPILTAAVFACQVGSAFAAEIASMKLTEQIDALKLLRTDPIDYLVMPRVLACALMLPFLTIIGLFVGVLGGLFITGVLYDVTAQTFLQGVHSSLAIMDVLSVLAKASLFGGAMAITSCSRGLTAACHGKGVGRSVTSAVVISWIVLFVIDFLVTVTTIVLSR